MRRFILILILLMLPIQVRAEEVMAKVFYKDYLSQVLNYYPTLKKEQASVEKAIAAKAVIAASRMPHLAASLGGDYGNDPVYVFGALLRQNRFTNNDFALDHLNTPKSRRDNSVSMDAEWVLFDFFQTTNKVASAGYLAESAQYRSELTQMEAILAASELYDRLAVTDQLLDDVTRQAELGKQDIDAMDELSRKGLALGADFYLARMTLSQIVSIKNELLSQRDAVSMAFNILRGIDPLTTVKTEGVPTDLLVVTGAVEEYIEKAVENRLDIKSLAKMMDAGSLDVSAQRKSIAPKIIAYGNAAKHSQGSLGDGGDSYMAGVKMKVDLDPGYGSQVKLAQAEKERLTAQLQEAKDRAAQDVTEVFFRLKAMGSNSVLAKQDSADAQQAVQLLAPLYKEGRRSVSEMLSTRKAQVAALERSLKLEASSRMAQLSLALFTGELTPEKAGEVYEQ